jgi:hypothetical protein
MEIRHAGKLIAFVCSALREGDLVREEHTNQVHEYRRDEGDTLAEQLQNESVDVIVL